MITSLMLLCVSGFAGGFLLGATAITIGRVTGASGLALD